MSVVGIDRSARERLRPLLGDDVDKLSEVAASRVLGAVFATARREVERLHAHDGQLELDAA